jgi:hypothetical protein
MTDAALGPEERLKQLLGFFQAKDYAACLSLAGQMALDQQLHPVQVVVLAVAAEELGDSLWYNRALQLIDHMLSYDPGMAASLRSIERLVAPDLVRKWFANGDAQKVLQHLAVARRTDPAIASVFEADPEAIIARGNRACIPDQLTAIPVTRFAEKPSGRPVPRRRALIFGRKYFFGPNSRPHDIGPRMARGLKIGGWDSICIDPGYPNDADRTPHALTPALLVDHCMSFQADMVLIDHFGLAMAVSDWGDFATQIRRIKPEIKLVHLNFDPWISGNWPLLQAIGAQVDLIWSHFPAGEYWDSTQLRHKLAYHPFPVGIELGELSPSVREDKTAFQGATESYNFNRVYWLTLLAKVGLSVEQRVTVHKDDGLDPIESYRQYLSRFCSVDRLLSFSMRSDGSRIVTGRSFETIFSGGCLIQEQAEDLEHFFVPGEHYFRFSTFNELRGILAFLHHNPDAARKVAAAGQAYYRQH